MDNNILVCKKCSKYKQLFFNAPVNMNGYDLTKEYSNNK